MRISTTIATVCILVWSLFQTAHFMTTTSVESTTIADGCPSGLNWKPDNQSCYLHLSEGLNFTNATNNCKRLGANLVSIGSEEENQFILHFVGAINMPVWIGLYRTTSDSCNGDSCGNWMWLDRSELGFSHWAPDLLESTGQCVFIDSQGDWDHSRACSKERGYVCKQKRIFPATILESTTAMRPIDMTETLSSDPVDNIAPTTVADKDGINLPLLIGCVVGGLVFVCIITASAVTLHKRHRQSSTNEQQNDNKRGNSLTQVKENISSPRDLLKEDNGGKTSQRNQSNVDKDIDSSPTDERQKSNKEDRPTKGVNGRFNRGYCYEDVEAEMTIEGFQSGPAISDIGARGRELNPDNIYAEPIKKKDR